MGLDLLVSMGLMQHIMPELVELDSERGRQNPYYHSEGNVWQHTRMVVRLLTGSSFELMLGGLLHDVGKPAARKVFENGDISHHGHEHGGARMAEAICRRLKLSNEQTWRVVELVAQHMLMHRVHRLRLGELVPLLERPDIHDLIALQHADALGRGVPRTSNREYLLRKLRELSETAVPSQRLGAKPIVNGAMLTKLGFRPGPRFKTILDQSRMAQREGDFVDVTSAEEWVRTHFCADR